MAVKRRVAPKRKPPLVVPGPPEMAADPARRKWAAMLERRRRKGDSLWASEDEFDRCVSDYLAFCAANPIAKRRFHEGAFLEEPCDRIPTAVGFRTYAGLSASQWRRWKDPGPDGSDHRLAQCVRRACDVFENAVVERALHRILDGPFAARVVGLADNQIVETAKSDHDAAVDRMKVEEMLEKVDQSIEEEREEALRKAEEDLAARPKPDNAP